jgi:excisionase family DNA binding protein
VDEYEQEEIDYDDMLEEEGQGLLDYLEKNKIVIEIKPKPSKKCYTVSEVAEIIGVCTNTVYTSIKQGQIKATDVGTKGGRQTLRIYQGALDEYMGKTA